MRYAEKFLYERRYPISDKARMREITAKLPYRYYFAGVDYARVWVNSREGYEAMKDVAEKEGIKEI